MRKPVNLIITDLRMPIMSGQQMLIEIRNFNEKYSKGRVKLIILSGELSETEHNKCLSLYGADDFLQKPIIFEKLTRSINQLFSAPGQKEQIPIVHLMPLNQRKILIVDDDFVTVSVIKQFLKPLGLAIVHAGSMKEVTI